MPYQCSRCERSFASSSALAQHARDTGHTLPIPSPCSGCARAFVDAAALGQHLNSPAHAATKPAPAPAASVTCGVCGRGFRTAAALSDHLTSTGHASPHVCADCHRSFRTAGGLQQHRSSPAHAQPARSEANDGHAASAVPVGNSAAAAPALALPATGTHGGRSAESVLAPQSPPPPTAAAPPPAPPWPAIPAQERSAALAALASRCHAEDSLVRNRYRAAMPPPARQPTPARDPSTTRRCAVTLDCEMVGVGRNVNELARVSVVDYLTAEVLVDALVQPTRPVTDWRSQISGITPSAMAAAVAEGRALRGWPQTRTELWKHVDANTILVGHALNNDLEVLRVRHARIVDSGILAQDAVDVNRRWSLKDLSAQLLAVDIQNHGGKGHDSLEDALAAREVVLWCVGHEEELREWARTRRDEYIEQRKKRKQRRQQRQRPRTSRQKRPSWSCGPYYLRSSSNDDPIEVVRWEDIAEDCGWPHPDTGYDPWSD